MNFLNSAFDSSTFIRTNYMQALTASGANNANALISSNNIVNLRGTHLNNPLASHTKSSSIVIDMGTQGSSTNLISAASNTANNLISSKSSISTGQPGVGSSISIKNSDGRNLWLQSLASAANASAKRAYCSKTHIYCEAVSRALDMPTCKVVPFFGSFLHDLRFIIESVPSVTVMCNQIIQKPIEVYLKEKVYCYLFYLNWFKILLYLRWRKTRI